MNLSFSLPVSLPKAAFGGRVRSLYNDADAAQVNDRDSSDFQNALEIEGPADLGETMSRVIVCAC